MMNDEKWVFQSKVILAFVAIYIVWGASYYGILIALKSFPPFLLSSLRFLTAGVALLLVCFFKKETFPDFEDIKKNILCGIVMLMGGVVSVAWAQQFISSSLASIIVVTPFWFVILDKRQWHFYFSDKWIITGLIIGLIGVIMLMSNKTGTTSEIEGKMQFLGIMTIVFGSFLWASGSLYLKYQSPKASTYVNTCIQLLAAGLFCLLVSYFNYEPQNFHIQQIRVDAVVSMFFLSIVSSLITFMAYVWLIKVKPPALVSTYAYVNPVVAVLLGWGLAGESITIVQIFALFVILCGVLFVNIPKYKTM